MTGGEVGSANDSRDVVSILVDLIRSQTKCGISRVDAIGTAHEEVNALGTVVVETEHAEVIGEWRGHERKLGE